MDEYLFISMAKLGADRLKEERTKRAAALGVAAEVSPPEPSSVGSVPTTAAVRLAAFSLAFALGLAAIGLGIGVVVWPEPVPSGEVSVTAFDAGSNVPDEVRVAQRAVDSANER